MRSSISAACRRSAAARLRAFRAVPLVLAAFVACGVAPPWQAFAQARTETQAENPARAASDALEHARGLLAAGHADEALAAIDEGLKASPNDAQLRFQKGVILAQRGRTDEAIEVFQALTQAFPELPEPHNNLAALYAARGELDLAQSALEDALRALPSYALARENLGDVQLRLAERSYRRAIEADAGNRAAREKLDLTRQLLARIAPATGPAGAASAAAPSAAGASAPAKPASNGASVPSHSATPAAPVEPEIQGPSELATPPASR